MCVSAFSNSTGVLGLDACHLKTPHGGVLLVLTILDGNGQIIPGSLGIAESENVHTWKWFLSLVKTAFHIEDDGRGLVFLSDREKGLDDGLKELFPNAAHSFCVYHIEKNVKVRYKTTVEGPLFTAAKTPDENVFETVLQHIDNIHREAGNYIRKIDPAKWARSHFPARRFGHVTSNISESMNWWLEQARHLNPVQLFTTYIRKLNRLFERRRDKYSLMRPTQLPNKVSKMFNASVEDSRTLRVYRHTNAVFEVESKNDPGFLRVVNLETVDCSCGFYKEHGVPCRHICAAALFVGENPDAFVIRERRLRALKAMYTGTTEPVDLRLFATMD